MSPKISRLFENGKYFVVSSIRAIKNILTYGTIRKPIYIVFEREKLIYVPILKCANTSIKKCLATLLTDTEKKEEKFPIQHRLTSKHLDGSYTIFIVIRDPLERIASGYFNRVKNWKNDGTIKHLYGYFSKKTDTFENFLHRLLKLPLFLTDGHFSPMSNSIHFKLNKSIIIMDMEKLDEQFKPIQQKFNLPKLVTYNATSENKNDIIQKLPNELIKRFKKKYKKDYLLFKKVLKN